ncbi:hypothetical protein JYU34_009398 [Plutella xylostella]|nr:hypothetical protein JYU34_021832 [Plutella xylostella]KAG7296839.1 hypothetical protein JYU34_019695 [Plutella xylostella]KAG7299623.1 hypothetical protein JYU34_016609 [Plutella xylostella]KAG7303116.1 hypothetical protein JYU34_013145 [Plutella xylostella]KAG7305336.1 hypothetical protein JYU34_009398 [Plutella xylostella]
MCNSVPPPRQENNNFMTQVGLKNSLNQESNNILGHLNHMNWYMFLLLLMLAVVILFFLGRYINISCNKKIERRAAAQSMRLRRTTSGTGMGAGDDDDYKRQHFVKQ